MRTTISENAAHRILRESHALRADYVCVEARLAVWFVCHVEAMGVERHTDALGRATWVALDESSANIRARALTPNRAL